MLLGASPGTFERPFLLRRFASHPLALHRACHEQAQPGSSECRAGRKAPQTRHGHPRLGRGVQAQQKGVWNSRPPP